MKLIKVLTVVVALAFLSGCAKNFVRPASDALELGKSSEEEIVKLVGKPTLQSDEVIVNGEKTKHLTYYYNDGAKFWGLIIPQRTLLYSLHNDRLVGEQFNSTMDGEVTEFEGGKAALIQKGRSTKAEVISLMGKPSGMLIYPMVKDKTGSALVYAYSYARFAGMLTSYNHFLLTVTLDDKNIVTEVSYKKDEVEQL